MSGSSSGAMTCSHYIRAWQIHAVMFEKSEYVRFKRFLNEMLPNISDEIHDLASEKSDAISLGPMQNLQDWSLIMTCKQ